MEPTSLGITDMFFLQQKDLPEDAQGRITLGPLECVETSKFTISRYCWIENGMSLRIKMKDGF